jgi:hypothetical protein
MVPFTRCRCPRNIQALMQAWGNSTKTRAIWVPQTVRHWRRRTKHRVCILRHPTFRFDAIPIRNKSDLQSSTSQFSTHQWGACGYISWSNLLTQTNRHEFNSSTQSHYGFYTVSINSSANNPGDFFEQQVAPPGADLNAFANAARSGLNSRYTQIVVATSVEPFPVNDSETGTLLGNINYAPYATCP